jgi:branched-chain amino acid transport system ATP-binding protein
LLTLEGIDAFYGDLQALHGVSLDVQEGEIVALVGANAAGKTTTLRVISGTLPARTGRVTFTGQDLTRVAAHDRVGHGIVQVPEGRRLFPFMTVRENLLLGRASRGGAGRAGEEPRLRARSLPHPRRADEPARRLALRRGAADVRDSAAPS